MEEIKPSEGASVKLREGGAQVGDETKEYLSVKSGVLKRLLKQRTSAKKGSAQVNIL